MDVARPDLKQRRVKQRKMVLAAVTVCALGFVAAALWIGNARPNVDQADVLIDVVERGDFVRVVRGTGELVPSQMRWVIARNDASVERVLVRAGASVKADTLIIELTNPDVQDRLQTAELAFAAAEGDHRGLRSRLQSELLAQQSEHAEVVGELEAARVEEEASLRGLQRGVIAEVEYRKRQIALKQLQERVRIAEMRVEQSRSSMQSQIVASQARLDQLRGTKELRQQEANGLRIKAGLDGILQQIQVEEGQRVTAGQSLARVAREGSLVAELRVPEAQSADLKSGQEAEIELGRARIPGKVRRVDPAVENGAILVEVELAAALPDGARAEQSVEGSITVDRVADTLFVGRPVNAVPLASGHVFRMRDSNVAERVLVRYGKESVDEIEIEGGLEQGDRLILSDTSRFDQFDALTVD